MVTCWSARDARNTANPLRGSSFSCISSLLLQMPSWTKKIIQKAPGETPKASTKAPQRSSGGLWSALGASMEMPAPSPESSKRALGPPRGLRECFRRYLGLIFELWRPLFSHFQAISHHHASIIKQQSSLIDHHSSLVSHLNDQHQSSMIIIDHHRSSSINDHHQSSSTNDHHQSSMIIINHQ